MNPNKVLKLLQQAAEAMQTGKFAVAEFKLRKAQQLSPSDPQIGLHLALALFEQNKLVEATSAFRNLLQQHPDFPQAWLNLGMCLSAQGKAAESAQAWLRYLDYEPDDARALTNAGAALLVCAKLEKSLALFDRAIALMPDFGPLHHNRAQVLKCLERFDEALQAYARAQQLAPDFADAHWGEATCLLAMGEFARGWEKYEWRRKRPQSEYYQHPRQGLEWQGEIEAGSRILLYSAQGMGDTLQFFRYVPLLIERGLAPILEVQTPLIPLLNAAPVTCPLVARNDPSPAYDFHFPLMSLPHLLETRLDTIPSPGAYLSVPAKYQEKWRQLLGPRGNKPRVGLAWTGSSTHADDLQRSMSLTDCLPLLTNDYEFFVVQKDVRLAERKLLQQTSALRDFSPHIDDFADTAALTAEMDLILSVDTANAHLAGALGKPCWLMLPQPAEWRWLTGRHDSPWYASLRLFRQPAPGDWAAVVQAIRAALPAHSFADQLPTDCA